MNVTSTDLVSIHNDFFNPKVDRNRQFVSCSRTFKFVSVQSWERKMSVHELKAALCLLCTDASLHVALTFYKLAMRMTTVLCWCNCITFYSKIIEDLFSYCIDFPGQLGLSLYLSCSLQLATKYSIIA